MFDRTLLTAAVGLETLFGGNEDDISSADRDMRVNFGIRYHFLRGFL